MTLMKMLQIQYMFVCSLNMNIFLFESFVISAKIIRGWSIWTSSEDQESLEDQESQEAQDSPKDQENPEDHST
jgi:hypothetical protein